MNRKGKFDKPVVIAAKATGTHIQPKAQSTKLSPFSRQTTTQPTIYPFVVVALQKGVTDGQGHAVKLGDRLATSSVISTGPGAQVTIVTRAGSRISMAENTRYTLNSPSTFGLASGRAYVVSRKHEFKRIDTSAGCIQLLGTTLDTAVLRPDKVSVTVVSGKVVISNAHGNATVEAGKKAILTASAVPESGTTVDTSKETAWYDGRGKLISDFGKISYVVQRPNSNISEVWTMNADGGGKERLKSYLGYMQQPGPWFPGAQWLQIKVGSLLWTAPDFIRHRASTGGGHPIVGHSIYVLNAANCVDMPAGIPEGYNAIYPALSPDGRQIAFTGYFDNSATNKFEGGLYLYDMPSGKVTKLIDGNLKSPPSWSPDGQLIAVSRGEGYDLNHPLVLVNAKTGQIQDLNTQGAGPVFSPDGKRIAYCGDFKDSGSWSSGVPTTGSILVKEIGSSTEPTRISPNKDGVVGPSWSPDGTKILTFICDVDWSQVDATGHVPEHVLVYVSKADGSDSRLVYKADLADPRFRGAFWAADSNAIYAATDTTISVIAADGSGTIRTIDCSPETSSLSPEEAQQTSQASAAVEEAVYQFALGNIRTFDGNPDEARAAFKKSSDIFSSLPWKYPLANLSIENCLNYADVTASYVAKDNEAILADGCNDRMMFLTQPLYRYIIEEKHFPKDVKTLEDSSEGHSGTVNWLSLDTDTERTRMMFACPGTTTTPPTPYIYAMPTDPKDGDIIVTCPNHPQNSVKIRGFMLRALNQSK